MSTIEGLNMSLTTKVKVEKFSFFNAKSYNKTVIDFNFGRHKDLSTLKSDIHLGLAASVNYHFFGHFALLVCQRENTQR